MAIRKDIDKGLRWWWNVVSMTSFWQFVHDILLVMMKCHVLHLSMDPINSEDVMFSWLAKWLRETGTINSRCRTSHCHHKTRPKHISTIDKKHRCLLNCHWLLFFLVCHWPSMIIVWTYGRYACDKEEIEGHWGPDHHYRLERSARASAVAVAISVTSCYN